MTTRETEDRVRSLWPSPPAGLRERVLAAATLRTAEAPAVGHVHPVPMTEPQAFRRPVWRTAPVLFAIAALIVVGACTGLDLWAQRDLNIEIARLEAKYGSLDEATIKVPHVPDDDNRARVVRAAAARTVPIPGHAYNANDLPVSSPVPADLREFADANSEAIRVLGDIRTRHQSNWEVDYLHGSLPPWESVDILSKAMFVTVILDLQKGRPDEAAGVIVSGLGMTASLRQEPDGLAQTVRILTVAPYQVKAIRHLLSASTPSAPALKELAWWLAENRAPDPMQIALLAGLKQVNGVLRRMENGDIDRRMAEQIYPETWPDWPAAFLGPAARIGRPLVRTARVRSLRHIGQVLDDVTGPRPRPASKEPPPPQPWALVDRLVGRMTRGIWDAGNVEDDFASSLGLAELGVALRRFKLDRFDYPADLSALVPNYLDHLPIDPYTGRPFSYTRQGTGFTLRATGSRPGMREWAVLDWDVKR